MLKFAINSIALQNHL